jgi:hypothetical protein
MVWCVRLNLRLLLEDGMQPERQVEAPTFK